MIEILNFIFSSFWIWLGTFLLLGVISLGIYNLFGSIIKAIRR